MLALAALAPFQRFLADCLSLLNCTAYKPKHFLIQEMLSVAPWHERATRDTRPMKSSSFQHAVAMGLMHHDDSEIEISAIMCAFGRIRNSFRPSR